MNMNNATATATRTQPPTEAARLYAVFMATDVAFQAQLVKEHGKQAGDVRYQPAKQSAEVRRLGEVFSAAGQAWRDEVRKRDKE